MELNKARILTLSAIVEGALILIFCVWALNQDYTYRIMPTFDEFKYGFLWCIPLLIFNYILFGPLADKAFFLKDFKHFKKSVVKPIADELDYVSAFCVALAAGIGEELFFRGVIQTEFGIVVASVLFAVLHFGPALRSYYLIALIYLIFGFYFGYMRIYTESLWAPIITHGLYDYLALLYMRYIYKG
jgi:uncharacterized protein